jgi:glutamate dehydrogenase
MITSDPARRAQILDDITRHLDRLADPADRERLLAFARVAFAETPDTLALRLPAPALAERLRSHYHFVAKTMPLEHQLFRGLPGIHVSVRNPDEEEAAETGSASGHYHEITIVELHTPDAPFIFESLKNFFQNEGLRVFSAIHPIFTVRRQWEQIVWIGGPGDDGARELYCQFRIERVEARERLRRLEHQIYSLLKSVFLAVDDHGEMQRALRDLMPRLRPRPEGASSLETVKAFIGWLLDDNYVHLGQLHFARGQDGQLHAEEESALGFFKDPSLIPTVFPGLVERMNSYLTFSPGEWRIVDLDYPTNISAIHHLEPIDDILIREWSEDGALAAGTLMVGRLAKSALAMRAQDIPILNHKLTSLLEKSGALPNSHAFREIRAIFNHFPKRELLYADTGSLKEIIDRMVYMTGDDEIAVSTRQGRGYLAVRIAFSDRRYSPRAEEELKTALSNAFGPISFNTWADCGTNGVLIYYFDESSLEHPVDAERVRDLTRKVITTWEDQAALALEYAFGPIDGRRLFKKYVRSESRSGLYRESTRPEEVPDDLRCLEQLEARLEMAVLPGTPETATIKLFAPQPLALTRTLRTLQNLGLGVTEEISMPLALPEGRKGFLSRLVVEAEPPIIASTLEGRGRLLDALRALHEERATECPLNGLVLLEGLEWREVEMLRTFRNHLLQLRPHYNADTLTGVLLRNAGAARALFEEFAARFDPVREADRAGEIDRADRAVRRALRAVSSLLDDEILRGLQNLIQATVRTNFYQQPERPVFSIKVESARVEGMVSPRPLFEIYVHSRALEGIHLRGGKVARGGIRWSDRHDDFRTEILGLMKTQMVKNSIIVPVGSKGGFVLKGTVPPRPALDQYLVMRYRQFISGLLDVTDNLVNGEVVHPPEVVRHDGPDPYLVVAADKGTAHLSDTANQVSAQYGFWLGDAFASGGSVGYDHKREGITARGAWECVRHHFRTLGVDVQSEPFTMAGIGDMSGDVFGNGALRSRATKLVAAFDHRHIFLDPEPDPERSFAERQRLFRLPRSSWRDYDASLISKGGGVFDRTAKSIPLSRQVQALLDTTATEASGEEVIRLVLAAKVDLLYNGGIGTYIKATGEEDADVGDRANDRVRVNAAEVRARVVAEGGNLGVTQPGRIEYWRHGGLINTDAVDNSGGVDMSDHEVNIKILLDLLVRAGVIAGRRERNALLAGMTDEVSELVLEDNRQQALALTLDGFRSASSYDEFVALVDELVAAGVVKRSDAEIPSRAELLATQASDRGLPRPVVAVLLGHVKNWGFEQVLKTDVPDGPLGLPFLERYFPAQLRDRHAEHFPKHPLKREIVATAAVNHLVNHAGIAFIHRTAAATGAAVGEVIAAYLEADRESGSQAARAGLLAAGRPIHDELAELLDIETRLAQAVRDRLAGGAPAGSGGATRRGKL